MYIPNACSLLNCRDNRIEKTSLTLCLPSLTPAGSEPRLERFGTPERILNKSSCMSLFCNKVEAKNFSHSHVTWSLNEAGGFTLWGPHPGDIALLHHQHLSYLPHVPAQGSFISLKSSPGYSPGLYFKAVKHVQMTTTSLVVQCQTMPGMWVLSLVGEDSTCQGTKPMHHSS